MTALAALALGAIGTGSVAAQDQVFGAQTFKGNLDLRVSASGGETRWLDGGFGKLREGGDEGDTDALLRVASADLAWVPRFSWAVSGLVSVTRQAGQSNDLDLNEGYLAFRSGPAPTRLSARAGMFWPPISQEHEGANWLVADSITPSAVNSWIGEEVKVLGLEGKIERAVGDQRVALTAAVFRHNDMAGTLLTYRGWALHDVRMTANGDFALPPLSTSTAPFQAPITTPFLEVDGRTGYYARADWQTGWPVQLNLLHYDNRGDRVSSRNLQTAWRTLFWNGGATAALGDGTQAKAQVLWGRTLVGPDTPASPPMSASRPPTCCSAARPVRARSLSAATCSARTTTASSSRTTTTRTAGRR
jgi:hypothetical protein